MSEKQICLFCKSDKDGNREIFRFEHPTNPKRSAIFGITEGKLFIDFRQPEDAIDQRISCEISFCPLCGRELSDDENNPDLLSYGI